MYIRVKNQELFKSIKKIAKSKQITDDKAIEQAFAYFILHTELINQADEQKIVINSLKDQCTEALKKDDKEAFSRSYNDINEFFYKMTQHVLPELTLNYLDVMRKIQDFDQDSENE